MTLRFDATVGPPRQGIDGFVPPEWGFTLAPGDAISGTFTFEPVDQPSSVHTTAVVESMQYSLNIKSKTLTSTQYDINVEDDHFAFDAFALYDHIFLGCTLGGSGTSCTPNGAPGSNNTRWASMMDLYGPTAILDGADVPGTANEWQQFFADKQVDWTKGLLVTVINYDTNKSYGFLADLSSFSLVPEPASIIYLTILWAMSICCRRSRNSGESR